MANDTLKYKNGKFTVNGNEVADVELVNTVSGNVASVSANTSQFSTVDNTEYIEVKLDSEGKIIEGITSDGVAEHHITHKFDSVESDSIKTNHLSLSSEGLTEFEQALKDHGFRPGGTGDWSEYLSNDGDNPLCIPEPRCAKLNIISDFNLSNLKKAGFDGGQAGVNYDIPTQVEFWDMQGNYFKKWTLMSGQGNSTMYRPKKNLAFDFFDSEANGDSFKVKFGDWLPFDSFHLKAYELEITKAKSIGAYKLYDEILKSHGNLYDYNWKRGLIDLTKITPNDCDIKDDATFLLELDNGATCFPKGFPVIVYQNGNFHGIYIWQIKKDRNNYKLDKNNSKHIHLDGEVFDIFSYNGNLDWDVISGKKPDSFNITAGIEIRNPKGLYLMDGTKYDADFNLGELIDTTSTFYDASNKNHKRTMEVKNALITMSSAMTAINNAKEIYNNSEKTESDLNTFKNVFETYYDSENLIDYLIFSDVLINWDGFNHNVQWTTWNGVRWYTNAYDVDNTFGGQYAQPAKSHVIYRGEYTKLPMFFILLEFYQDRLEERYKELRDLKIIDAQNICDLMTSFQKRIAPQFFEFDRIKWVEELYRNSYDSVYRIRIWLDTQIKYMDELYNYN